MGGYEFFVVDFVMGEKKLVFDYSKFVVFFIEVYLKDLFMVWEFFFSIFEFFDGGCFFCFWELVMLFVVEGVEVV